MRHLASEIQVGQSLPADVRAAMRVSYALRRVPERSLHTLLPCPETPQVGDIVLAKVESVGKNLTLDIRGGRRCTLNRGDLVAVVFGNRYATLQFEGYARAEGDRCHLLSVGGLCGIVESKHDAVSEPTKLRLLGALGDEKGLPLRLQNFAVVPQPPGARAQPRVAVVLGTSMDAGKTYTARSVILGLQRHGIRAAGIKLTGTAAGRDTFSMLDAGACSALDFVDGGLPSTYRSSLTQLLDLYRLLVDEAASKGAAWVVVEIADGIIQGETAALIASTRFTSSVDAWLLAATDAVGVVGAMGLLQRLGVTPLAVSGVVSRSALARREVELATNVPCMAAAELEEGALNAKLMAASPPPGLQAVSGEQPAIRLR